jgi:hypothetical protein
VSRLWLGLRERERREREREREKKIERKRKRKKKREMLGYSHTRIYYLYYNLQQDCTSSGYNYLVNHAMTEFEADLCGPLPI